MSWKCENSYDTLLEALTKIANAPLNDSLDMSRKELQQIAQNAIKHVEARNELEM